MQDALVLRALRLYEPVLHVEVEPIYESLPWSSEVHNTCVLACMLVHILINITWLKSRHPQ